MLLQEGSWRSTGVLHLSFPLKTPPDIPPISCTQERTESWALREVDGHQSLRPPTCWRVYLPTHPTTEGPVSTCLPGTWVWVQMDEKKGEFSRCFGCFISTVHVFSFPATLQMLPTSPPSQSSQQERRQRGGRSP